MTISATIATGSNPFALLVNPAAVFAAYERSGALGGMPRQVFRPLDKPRLFATRALELAAVDADIDAEIDTDAGTARDD